MKDMERVEELLDQAYAAEDEEGAERLAREILRLDEDNVEGLMLLADVVPYSEEKRELLERARGILEEAGDSTLCFDSDDPEGQERCTLYMAVLQRLGFSQFSEGDDEAALDTAMRLIELDTEGITLARSLLYRVLIEQKRDRDVLEASMNDAERSPSMLYSRAIATWRLSGAGKASAKALWEAIREAPMVPFYILGYFEEPDGDDVDAMEDYNMALFYEDAWSSDRGLLNWLAQAAILLGLSASLFPGKDTENMMILADALHVADIAEDVMVRLEGRTGWGERTKEERISEAIDLLVKAPPFPSGMQQ